MLNEGSVRECVDVLIQIKQLKKLSAATFTFEVISVNAINWSGICCNYFVTDMAVACNIPFYI